MYKDNNTYLYIIYNNNNQDWKSWKLEDELKLSKLQHCRDQLGYSEESWRPKKTCCHSGFCDGWGKTHLIIKIIIMIWILPFQLTTEWKTEKAKRDKHLNLARELRKLLNMRVTLLPIVIGTLGMTHKGLEREQELFEIRRWLESIQTTALLRSARILRRVLET